MGSIRKPTVEGPFGVRMTEDTARKVDALVKELPKDKAFDFRRKGAVADVNEISPAERTDVSLVTTATMDRDFEIVLPDGIDLTDYRLNPIVLWGHDQDRPVGKALWIDVFPEGVKAKTYYLPRPGKYDGEWLPDFVFGMVQADVLRGKSIGFLPLEIREATPEEIEANPGLQVVITRSLLLEYSVVSVPSNPAALVEAVGKGAPLGPWKFEVVGKVRKKLPPKKAAPKIDLKRVADDLARISHDPARIADEAVKLLLSKWEV